MFSLGFWRQIDWESIKILGKERNTNKRLILEMYHKHINIKSGSRHLTIIYKYLMPLESSKLIIKFTFSNLDRKQFWRSFKIFFHKL